MNLRILASVVLVKLLVFSSSTVQASNPQAIPVLNDAYVQDITPFESYGHVSYLKVSDSQVGLSLAFLMFNLSEVSYTFNASSEVKLQLRVLNITSPHNIGVHWYVNNTWNEENWTFNDLIGTYMTDEAESIITISSNGSWYEWTVTEFIYDAMQQLRFDRLTLVLQAEKDSPGENDYVLFYSKDQNRTVYWPQLIFSYRSPASNPPYTSILIILGFVAVAGVAFMVYRFSRKRQKYYRKSRFQKSVKRD